MAICDLNCLNCKLPDCVLGEPPSRCPSPRAAYYHRYYTARRRALLERQRETQSRNAAVYRDAGAEIRSLRLAHGLTQHDTALLIGVSPTALGQWERGEAPPQVRRVKEFFERMDKNVRPPCKR